MLLGCALSVAQVCVCSCGVCMCAARCGCACCVLGQACFASLLHGEGWCRSPLPPGLGAGSRPPHPPHRSGSRSRGCCWSTAAGWCRCTPAWPCSPSARSSSRWCTSCYGPTSLRSAGTLCRDSGAKAPGGVVSLGMLLRWANPPSAVQFQPPFFWCKVTNARTPKASGGCPVFIFVYK